MPPKLATKEPTRENILAAITACDYQQYARAAWGIIDRGNEEALYNITVDPRFLTGFIETAQPFSSEMSPEDSVIVSEDELKSVKLYQDNLKHYILDILIDGSNFAGDLSTFFDVFITMHSRAKLLDALVTQLIANYFVAVIFQDIEQNYPSFQERHLFSISKTMRALTMLNNADRDKITTVTTTLARLKQFFRQLITDINSHLDDAASIKFYSELLITLIQRFNPRAAFDVAVNEETLIRQFETISGMSFRSGGLINNGGICPTYDNLINGNLRYLYTDLDNENSELNQMKRELDHFLNERTPRAAAAPDTAVICPQELLDKTKAIKAHLRDFYNNLLVVMNTCRDDEVADYNRLLEVYGNTVAETDMPLIQKAANAKELRKLLSATQSIVELVFDQKIEELMTALNQPAGALEDAYSVLAAMTEKIDVFLNHPESPLLIITQKIPVAQRTIQGYLTENLSSFFDNLRPKITRKDINADQIRAYSALLCEFICAVTGNKPPPTNNWGLLTKQCGDAAQISSERLSLPQQAAVYVFLSEQTVIPLSRPQSPTRGAAGPAENAMQSAAGPAAPTMVSEPVVASPSASVSGAHPSPITPDTAVDSKKQDTKPSFGRRALKGFIGALLIAAAIIVVLGVIGVTHGGILAALPAAIPTIKPIAAAIMGSFGSGATIPAVIAGTSVAATTIAGLGGAAMVATARSPGCLTRAWNWCRHKIGLGSGSTATSETVAQEPPIATTQTSSPTSGSTSTMLNGASAAPQPATVAAPPGNPSSASILAPSPTADGLRAAASHNTNTRGGRPG